MRSRGVALVVVLSALSAGGAAGCYWKAQRLWSESAWLLEKARAHADGYTRTFDGRMADKQLITLAQRRELLERAHGWDCSRRLLVIAGVLLALTAQALRLLGQLRELPPEAGDAPPPAPAPTLRPPPVSGARAFP